MSKEKNWTGERLETFITGETMIEHLHRYAIAMELVKGKAVLDIACGEGYGANLLAQHAAHVTGVDIDTLTVEKAKKKYPSKNLIFKQGTVSDIPCNDNFFDIVISFETLEHTDEHDKFISEVKRVLKPGGLFVISTPDKSAYSDKAAYKNPFHKKELYENEFKELMQKYFSFTSFYKQSSFIGSSVLKEPYPIIERIYSGNYNGITKDIPFVVFYHIAFASAKEFPQIPSSIFQNDQTLNQILEKQQSALKQTTTYKTGNFILTPLKFIRSLFKK